MAKKDRHAACPTVQRRLLRILTQDVSVIGLRRTIPRFGADIGRHSARAAIEHANLNAFLGETLAHERGGEALFGVRIQLIGGLGIGGIGFLAGGVLAKEGGVLSVRRPGIAAAALFTANPVFGDEGDSVRSAWPLRLC